MGAEDGIDGGDHHPWNLICIYFYSVAIRTSPYVFSIVAHQNLLWFHHSEAHVPNDET